MLDDGRSILERKTACDVEITPDDLNVYVLRQGVFCNPCECNAIGQIVVFKCRFTEPFNIDLSSVLYGVWAHRRWLLHLIRLVKAKDVCADATLEYRKSHDLGWQQRNNKRALQVTTYDHESQPVDSMHLS